MGATTVLVSLSPLLILVSVFIKLDGGTLFYNSIRYVGSKKSVKIYKFRSMVMDAKSSKYDLEGRYMDSGYLDIPIDCEVYTRIGRFLERTQLVEVPQMWNVILGQMSIVGNRPLPKRNLKLLSKISGWNQRFDAPCGITGVSQVVGKLKLSPAERLNLEKMYTQVYQNGNILVCDFMIIFMTIRLLLTSRPLPYEKAVKLLTDCLDQKK